MDELIARNEPRPTFDPHLETHLRQRLEEGLAPYVDGLAEPLRVTKHALARVHACEASYIAEQKWTGWSVAAAQGEVSHRAIQLSVAATHNPTPLELVDHTLDDLAADELRPLGQFVAGLAPIRRGELRAHAANAVATFLECWPPVVDKWWPRAELAVQAELLGGRVLLTGKVDLCLGRARGTEARCLFVDLKTGRRYPVHADDLRFYALIQALRIGVPPFRVASYYLASASFAAEDVTEEILETALRRTLDGARVMAELQRSGGRPAVVTPCPHCPYCAARATCPGASDWESRDGEDDDMI